ncbi:MAG: hypothetical protein K0S41_3443 [Anaerocolumna sp.]|jgi:hypothetical protein|nr:hypothetical protein [Anaerocolumna sp.]
MNHAYKMLHQAFGVFLFCVALTSIFFIYTNYLDTLQRFNQVLNDEIIYEQTIDVTETYYTKGYIIAFLLNELTYDVEIDGFVISQRDNIKDKITSYSIENKNFTKGYLYDANGTVIRIVFKSI